MTTSGVITKAGAAILSEASTGPSDAFVHGTFDLMGAFKALEGHTGTFERVIYPPAMDRTRHAELIEQLVVWSTQSIDGFDWDVLDSMDPPAPSYSTS